LSLYFFVRLFTSTYLFLSGYGHFMYYWHVPNYGITRFFHVLFRMNFLPIMLCFTMNRMYQFYSFIPLITFWYICAYVLMLVFPRVCNKSARDNYMHYFYMIIKIGVFIGLITALNVSEVLFERIFMAKAWKFLFVNGEDLISEWRVRWSHDCYSFAFGMLFGLLLCILSRLNFIEEIYFDDYSNENSVSTSSNEKMSSPSGQQQQKQQSTIDNMEILDFSENRKKAFTFRSLLLNIKIKFILTFLALCGLVSFVIFALLCKSKEDCDSVTSYINVIPIVSYFVLRNSVRCLREKVSFMFVWFGKIAIELYLCSYHIWSAADSNGILVLVPGSPVFNLLLTTFIFICISHELNTITKDLSTIVMPRDNWRVCLRNFLAFVILLMPIAIKYGYI
jgi:hypothetical protein